jgi:hypothetical protein
MPKDYDKIIKENFDEVFPALLKILLGIDLPPLRNVRSVKDKVQVTPEVELDNLKMAQRPDTKLPFLLHFEIQATDEDMRSRQLLYYGMVYHRYKLPVEQYVIYIGRKKAKKILNNRLELPNMTLEFPVLDLRSVKKSLFLQSGTPEGVVLAILSDFGKSKPIEVVREILHELHALTGNKKIIKKYHKQLLVLSRLRDLGTITLNEILKMPFHYDIKSDVLYNEGLHVGLEQGLEQGLEKGLEQGLEQGLEKGREQGLQQSVLKLLKSGILNLAQIMAVMDVSKKFVLDIAKAHNIEVKR